MLPTVPTEEERAEVIRSSLEVINSITCPIRVWGPLLDPREDQPIGLRIRALPIIVCCLCDVAEAPKRHLAKHIEKSRGWRGYLSHNLEVLALECRFAVETLIEVPYEDQIFLRLTRNRMVHGYLNGTTRDHQRLKFVDRYGVSEVSVTDSWATKILDDRDTLNPELLNGKRLEEILNNFDPLFQKYLERTEEHCLLDIGELKKGLKDDSLLIIKSSPMYRGVGANDGRS